MQTKIFCKINRSGQLDFYIAVDDERYFLFEQSYRKTVMAYFGNGVSFNQSMRFAGSTSYAVRNVMEKLPLYVKYVEKEYGVSVFEQTKRKRDEKFYRNRRNIKQNCYGSREGA